MGEMDGWGQKKIPPKSSRWASTSRTCASPDEIYAWIPGWKKEFKKELISDIWQTRGLDIWQKWGCFEKNLSHLAREAARIIRCERLLVARLEGGDGDATRVAEHVGATGAVPRELRRDAERERLLYRREETLGLLGGG